MTKTMTLSMPRFRSLRTLLGDKRGSEYIQNIAVIAFFVFAAIAGVTALGTAVKNKFNDTATSVGGMNVTIPAAE